MKKKRGKKSRKTGPSPRRQRRPSAPLDSIRERIDDIDRRIHELINERAQFAQQVGNSKRSDGHTVDFYRPEREAQVLRQALERNEGPLRDEEIVRLFREIMSACLAQQEPLKVAFLGPEGTFSQQAVLKHFGTRCGRCRSPPSAKCSRKCRPGTPISASCRSRTRPKAPSTTRSTCS